MDYHITWYKI